MSGWSVVALAEESKETALRDSVLGQLAQHLAPPGPGERPRVEPKVREISFCFNEALRAWLAAGAKGGEDLKPLDEAMDVFAPKTRGGLQCFVARILAAHKRTAEARAYFKRSALTREADPWLRAMAIRAARKGGVKFTDEEVAAP